MRHLALMLAVIVAVSLGSAGCAQHRADSAGGLASPSIVPAVLVPVDENGNLRGSVGPWLFLFDLANEGVRPPTRELDSTAEEIAAYLKEHSEMYLRIDGGGAPAGTDAQALGVRQRRIAAIRDAVIKAGVSADRIILGGAPTPYRWFGW